MNNATREIMESLQNFLTSKNIDFSVVIIPRHEPLNQQRLLELKHKYDGKNPSLYYYKQDGHFHSKGTQWVGERVVDCWSHKNTRLEFPSLSISMAKSRGLHCGLGQ